MSHTARNGRLFETVVLSNLPMQIKSNLIIPKLYVAQQLFARFINYVTCFLWQITRLSKASLLSWNWPMICKQAFSPGRIKLQNALAYARGPRGCYFRTSNEIHSLHPAPLTNPTTTTTPSECTMLVTKVVYILCSIKRIYRDDINNIWLEEKSSTSFSHFLSNHHASGAYLQSYITWK